MILDEFMNIDSLIPPIQDELIRILIDNGAMTRRDMVKELNKPRTTIYDNLLKLQKKKIVEKLPKNNGKKGRPLIFWRLTK